MVKIQELMLKLKKNFDISKHKQFHNKYISLVVNNSVKFNLQFCTKKTKKVKVLFKKRLSKIRLKNRCLRIRKTLVVLKPLKSIFNSIYNPRHLSYFKILYFQKKRRQRSVMLKRTLNLIFLKKLKLASRLCLSLEKFKKIKRQMLYNITIRIRRNNIFSTITRCSKYNRLICARSAGLYKIHLSKKTFRFNARYFLNKFFKDIKKHLKPKLALKRYYRLRNRRFKKTNKKLSKRKEWKKRLRFIPSIRVYAKIVAPKRMRKALIIRFLRLYKTNRYVRSVVLNVIEKKIFNGCRPKKKRRKKRQGLRVFK